MDLHSVEDIESELEMCKANLKRLQKALAEEKFKVIYLQTTVSRQRKDENCNPHSCSRGPGRRDEQPDGPRSQVCPPERTTTSSSGGGISSFGVRDRSRFSGRTGKPVPIPVPPRRTSSQKPADNQPGGGDRDYDDAELNDNFVRNNLLTPKLVARDSLRPFRHSRDFDSGDDGRLSPSLPQPPRPGSGYSTPDRRSDGYLSSDHDDSSSAGNSSMWDTSADLHHGLIMAA